jgi:hypothetical protein
MKKASHKRPHVAWFHSYKTSRTDIQMWWHTTIIPVFGRLRQEDFEFEASVRHLHILKKSWMGNCIKTKNRFINAKGQRKRGLNTLCYYIWGVGSGQWECVVTQHSIWKKALKYIHFKVVNFLLCEYNSAFKMLKIKYSQEVGIYFRHSKFESKLSYVSPWLLVSDFLHNCIILKVICSYWENVVLFSGS